MIWLQELSDNNQIKGGAYRKKGILAGGVLDLCFGASFAEFLDGIIVIVTIFANRTLLILTQVYQLKMHKYLQWDAP